MLINASAPFNLHKLMFLMVGDEDALLRKGTGC